MARSSDDERILVTIPISHFCEKARWALERAGLEYTEQRHIQIIHRFAVKRAGGGTTVPVLRAAEGVFDESSTILGYADEHTASAQRLYPDEPSQHAEVVELERRFDTVLGPQARLWLYHEVFKDARHFAPWNLTGVPGWERRIFPFVLAPAKIVIRRHFGISDRSAKEAAVRVDEEFDAVAERLSDGRRFLVGGRFSAADLSFAGALRAGACAADLRHAAAPARRHERGDGRGRPALALAPRGRVRAALVQRGAPSAAGDCDLSGLARKLARVSGGLVARS